MRNSDCKIARNAENIIKYAKISKELVQEIVEKAQTIWKPSDFTRENINLL